jgi:hypothetical protein
MEAGVGDPVRTVIAGVQARLGRALDEPVALVRRQRPARREPGRARLDDSPEVEGIGQ